MKREIKFRAWDESNKIMHHDFQFIRSGIEGNDWVVFTSDKQALSDKPHPLENPYFQLQLKIMQFTGLFDKNGKEIYEGDVYKVERGGVFQIIFKYGSFCGGLNLTRSMPLAWDTDDAGVLTPDSFNLNIEVIGNIYENPELLNP